MASTPANERSRASTVSSGANPAQPPANLSKEDAEDWLAVEKMLGRIHSVNPSDPYVLTIPQDVEPRYHHRRPEDKYQWTEHTPFSKNEHEASQYLTWHFHEPGGMYVLHSTRKEQPSSRVSTPQVTKSGPKKTMSLGAYKKKVAGSTPGPDEKKAEVNGTKKAAAEDRKKEGEKTVKKAAVKGPVERIKADEEVLAAVEDGEDIAPPPAEKKGGEVKKDLKRKREEKTDEQESRDVKRKREDSKISQGDVKDEKVAQRTKPQKETARAPEIAPAAAARKAPSSTKADRDQAIKSEFEASAAKKARPASSQGSSAATRPAIKIAPEQTAHKPQQPKSPKRLPPSPPKSSSQSSDIALPPRLSPLREETKQPPEDDISLLLPPRLSPTLPANITATLAAREQYKSSTAGDSLSPPRKALENGVARRKSPVNGFRANSSSPMVRSDAEDGRVRVNSTAPKVQSPSASGSDAALDKSAAAAKPEKKAKLIVKLKFKQRSTRESLKQLLKLPAARKKPEPKVSPPAPKIDARHREQRDPNAKGVAQKIGPAAKAKKAEKSATPTPAPSEKGVREENDEVDARPAKRKKADIAVYEPPAKRKKPGPDSPELKKAAPATPARASQQPPTPAPSVKKEASQPAATTTAPKKSGNDLLAAATTSAGLKRDPSHDTPTQALTPSAASSSPAASQAQPTTTTVPKSTPSASTPASTQQHPKTARQLAWEAQHKKLDTLGRELKRAATADLTALSATNPAPSTVEAETLRKTAAIKALESLHAYLLAFTSADEGLLAAEPRLPLRTSPWRTLLDYFPFVKRCTEQYPLLQGLACGLAVAACARTVEVSVGRANEKGGKDEVLERAWGVLVREAREGEGLLGVKGLMEGFPETWKGMGVEKEDGGKLEPGKFGGGYRLPLGVQTTPVRAVRAGCAMLGEWCGRELAGVGYELRVKLDVE